MKNKIKCAKELNKVLGVSPALPTDDSVSESVMDKKLKKAATMLTETEIEELSEVSVNVLTALGCEGFEAAEESEKEEDVEETPAPKKGKAKKEEPADDDDDEEDEKPKKDKSKKETEPEPKDEEDDDDAEKPVKGEKVAMKEEKETPAPKVKKEKKPKTAKRSRMSIICDVIKSLPKKGLSVDDAAQKVNEKYQDECGGKDNYTQSRHTLKVILPVLVEFELVEVDGEMLKPASN